MRDQKIGKNWTESDQNSAINSFFVGNSDINSTEIKQTYILEDNVTRDKKATLLIIPSEKMALRSRKKTIIIIKNIKSITLKYDRNFYCLNCFQSFTIEEK